MRKTDYKIRRYNRNLIPSTVLFVILLALVVVSISQARSDDGVNGDPVIDIELGFDELLRGEMSREKEIIFSNVVWNNSSLSSIRNLARYIDTGEFPGVDFLHDINSVARNEWVVNALKAGRGKKYNYPKITGNEGLLNAIKYRSLHLLQQKMQYALGVAIENHDYKIAEYILQKIPYSFRYSMGHTSNPFYAKNSLEFNDNFKHIRARYGKKLHENGYMDYHPHLNSLLGHYLIDQKYYKDSYEHFVRSYYTIHKDSMYLVSLAKLYGCHSLAEAWGVMTSQTASLDSIPISTDAPILPPVDISRMRENIVRGIPPKNVAGCVLY